MEVILSDCKKHPSCPHGPCLLFERYSANGSKTGKRFFACSACRDRSHCNFFQWADEEMSDKRKAIWEELKVAKRVQFSHEEYVKRLEAFKCIPVDQRQYCKTCSLFVLDGFKSHSDHDLIKGVTSEDLVHPSSLFEIRENKKVEAQYFFSESTVNFIVTLLTELGFTKLVSIGVPRIHEHITSQNVKGVSSFLMDIDYRYMQFFNPEQFCHYNMFNNHFFGGKSGKMHLKKFLNEGENEKVVIILDPPFGGMIDAISYSMKTINKWWQKENGKMEEQVPMLWVFPYFHEQRILKNLPDLKMTDFKVEYSVQRKCGMRSPKKTPVRIFTNIQASSFKLPVENGYRFCKKCERYVSIENKHCSKCKACTTKHGKTYHHCDHCKQCVKSSYIHCQKCNKCDLASEMPDICKNCKFHSPEDDQSGLKKCFKCHGVGHQKRNCPEDIRHVKRRKLQKKK